MPPLEAEKALFAFVVGSARQAQERGLAEMKLMFVDVKKEHHNARCHEEERVELQDELEEQGRYAKLRRWLYRIKKAASA